MTEVNIQSAKLCWFESQNIPPISNVARTFQAEVNQIEVSFSYTDICGFEYQQYS